MKHYISKDALVAEIERRMLEDYDTDDVEMDEVAQGVLASLKYLINTLEVKEEPELTVDDIMKLDALLISMWQSKSPNKYEEVLKQFKSQKGKEV